MKKMIAAITAGMVIAGTCFTGVASAAQWACPNGYEDCPGQEYCQEHDQCVEDGYCVHSNCSVETRSAGCGDSSATCEPAPHHGASRHGRSSGRGHHGCR